MSILLVEFNDTYFRDIASELLKQGISLSYIVTSFPNLYIDRLEFADATILDEKRFHYFDQVKTLNENNQNSLSKQIVRENFELESLYLSITDRLCFFPKTVLLRKQHYYELLLYWSTFLKENHIKKIIFPRVPHLGYGNIIYHLAKKMNLQVILVQETLLGDQIILNDDYKVFEKVPPAYLANTSLQDLKEKLGPKWLKTVFGSSVLMKINKDDNQDVLHKSATSLARDVFTIATLRSIVSLIHNPFKRVFASFTYLENATNWFQYYLMMVRYYLKNRKLLSFYQLRSVDVDLEQPFVYLALHYQPERTSMPEGDIFENQLLMVDILSKSLPQGWLLYVKEHPNQFARSDIRLMNFRSTNFYQKICSYKNIRLLLLDASSDALIAKCKTAVTLTGSTGWETLLAGKQAITFSSSAWYSPCASCHVVSSQAEAKRAFEIIQKTKKEQVLSDVLRFVSYYKNRLVNAPMSYEFVHLFDESYSQVVTNLSMALKKQLR